MSLDIPRAGRPLPVVSEYTPSGDQPTAIEELARRVKRGDRHVVLLGATGTGKSATTAWLVEKLQRPTLVLAPNKTLAAQLAKEFRELMPNNAVEYFVSYYDYYQPEAYIPQTDTYIEKDSSINEEVERLRHSATMSLLTRRDVIVVATVSAIYGLGTPPEYLERSVKLQGRPARWSGTSCCAGWSTSSTRATTWPSTGARSGCAATRWRSSPPTRSWRSGSRCSATRSRSSTTCTRSPATWCARSTSCSSSRPPTTRPGPERMERALGGIEAELEERLAELDRQGKLLEAQRLRMRTTYDIEMMRQVGFCSGIENYSMHIDGREPGSPPHCLLDYFPDDFLTVIDESHVTVPADRRHVRG